MGYSTELLDKALDRERKQQEKLRLRLLQRLPRVLDALKKEVSFREAYIFGSLTKPFGFSRRSDIDVGFVGLKDDDFFKAAAYLSGKIAVDVDVVQMERHRLRKKIKKEGIRWTKRP